ncbi:MAG: hypothetical protein NC320_10015 [Clostridium sp.]|nr:hypothetical protein [Clostridium sp.]MCM1547689.1 hypothetical protein [Ruminococcus sp.]
MIEPLNYFGISQNASREELDKAYEYLKKKNICDDDSDSLSHDISENKLKEIDEMYYQAIEYIKQGEARNGRKPQTDEPQESAMQPVAVNTEKSSNESPNNGKNIYIAFENDYQRICNFINIKHFPAAEQLLKEYDLEDYAKWHYLYARLKFTQGWMNEALEHYKKAYEIEPNNALYFRSYKNICDMRDGKVKKHSNAAAIGIAVGVGVFYACCQISPVIRDTPCGDAIGRNCTECAEESGCSDLCLEPCDNAINSYCDTLCHNCCGGCPG